MINNKEIDNDMILNLLHRRFLGLSEITNTNVFGSGFDLTKSGSPSSLPQEKLTALKKTPNILCN